MNPRRCGTRSRRLRGVWSPLAGAILLLCPLGAGPLRAEILINPQGWKFPNIMTAAKEVIRLSDRTPLIPGKETILRGYRKADGTHFLTYEIEGRVFGVQIDTDGKPPFEYSIMDTDGDGKFETKIIGAKDNKDKAYVPQWIIDFYYTRHPEMKHPGPNTKIPAPNIDTWMPQPQETPPPPPKVVVPPADARQQPNP
jgi:hypothetical protein